MLEKEEEEVMLTWKGLGASEMQLSHFLLCRVTVAQQGHQQNRLC